MFSGFMVDTWLAAGLVSLLAGAVGFYVVLRGASFAAHALPNGSFAGAAAAGLVGASTLGGLLVFAILGALLLSVLERRGRRDAMTALVLVLMLSVGALCLDLSSEYAPAVEALLFGEILGISSAELVPTAIVTGVCLLALAILHRPLLLSSLAPELARARGIRAGAIELSFLLVVALATAVTVPVVGTLLVFSLMIGAPATARSVCESPGRALVVSVVVALAISAIAIAGSYETDYPVGFFVGTASAGSFVIGRLLGARRRRGPRLASSAAAYPLT